MVRSLRIDVRTTSTGDDFGPASGPLFLLYLPADVYLSARGGVCARFLRTHNSVEKKQGGVPYTQYSMCGQEAKALSIAFLGIISVVHQQCWQGHLYRTVYKP